MRKFAIAILVVIPLSLGGCLSYWGQVCKRTWEKTSRPTGSVTGFKNYLPKDVEWLRLRIPLRMPENEYLRVFVHDADRDLKSFSTNDDTLRTRVAPWFAGDARVNIYLIRYRWDGYRGEWLPTMFCVYRAVYFDSDIWATWVARPVCSLNTKRWYPIGALPEDIFRKVVND